MRLILIPIFLIVIVATAFSMPFSWNRLDSLPEPIVSIQSDYLNGNVFFAVAASGQLLRSTDSGITWNPVALSTGYPVRAVWLDIAEHHAWFAIIDANGLYELWYTQNSGDTWEFKSVSTNLIRYLSPSPLATGLVIAAFETSDTNQLLLKKSEDRGINWIDVFSTQDPGVPPVWHTTSVWQIHWGKYASFDYGETWRSVSDKIVMDCGYDIPPSLLAPTTDGLFRSQDNLLTWWPVLKKPVSFVVTNPRNSQQLFCGQNESQPALYYSSNAGVNFSEWTNGLPSGFSKICFASDWQFFAVCDGAVYQYDERPGDIDQSLRIDGADLIILATSFGSTEGDPAFNPLADLNGDNVIDGSDLVILSAVFGHRFYYDEEKFPGDFPDHNP